MWFVLVNGMAVGVTQEEAPGGLGFFCVTLRKACSGFPAGW